MAQGVAVDGFPVTFYKGRYKQQQGALRLMEVGNHHLNDVVLVARSNDYLGAGLEDIQAVTVQVIQDMLQGFNRAHCGSGLIRSPLIYVHLILSSIRVVLR